MCSRGERFAGTTTVFINAIDYNATLASQIECSIMKRQH